MKLGILALVGIGIITITSNLPIEGHASGRYKFVSNDCVITGETNGKVKTAVGSNEVYKCTSTKTSMRCTQSGKGTITNFEIIKENGLLVGNSGGGNIKILGDLSTKTYAMASSHIILEKGMLMTKHCRGKIK